MGDERRVAERFRRVMTVSVRDLELDTTNVSGTGMQLICPELWIRRLRRAIDNDRLKLDVIIAPDTHIKVEGSVVYISEAGDEYLVGVHFEQFEGDGQSQWEACLA